MMTIRGQVGLLTTADNLDIVKPHEPDILEILVMLRLIEDGTIVCICNLQAYDLKWYTRPTNLSHERR